MSKEADKKAKAYVDNMFKDLKDPLKYSVEHMPTKPDPLWPDNAVPLHLSRKQLNEAKEVGSYSSLKKKDWKCEKCGTEVNPSAKNPKLCRSCAAVDKQVTSLAKKTNSDWMEIAKDLGLELFERQPEETDTEWRIWDAYRSLYPAKLPTYKELSELVGMSQSTVVKAAQRWSYKVRMVNWARYADASIQEKRIVAIKDMNEKHLSMATTITDKLKTALEGLQPELLKPGEIVNLFKVATELERKATTYVDEKVDNVVVESGASSKELTKPEDISEIVGILQAAGVLNNKNIGVKMTTTTEFIAKGEE